MDAECGESQSKQAAKATQEHALYQKLADKLPARGAESGTYRKFPGAPDGSAEHHVRDIRTRNEEHEPHRTEHDKENRADLLTVISVLKRAHDSAEVLVGVGKFGGEARSNNRNIRSGCVHGSGRLEETEEPKVLVSPAFDLFRRAHGHPKLLVFGEFKALGHHTDDRGWGSVDSHDTANYSWRTAVTALPNAVSEQHHGLDSVPVVGNREITAKHGRSAQQTEHTG